MNTTTQSSKTQSFNWPPHEEPNYNRVLDHVSLNPHLNHYVATRFFSTRDFLREDLKTLGVTNAQVEVLSTLASLPGCDLTDCSVSSTTQLDLSVKDFIKSKFTGSNVNTDLL
jgi:hypothetical protein